jgi:hypothetical protein
LKEKRKDKGKMSRKMTKEREIEGFEAPTSALNKR